MAVSSESFYRSCVPMPICRPAMTQVEFDNHDNNEECSSRLKKEEKTKRRRRTAAATTTARLDAVEMERKMYRVASISLPFFHSTHFPLIILLLLLSLSLSFFLLLALPSFERRHTDKENFDFPYPCWHYCEFFHPFFSTALEQNRNEREREEETGKRILPALSLLLRRRRCRQCVCVCVCVCLG
jgi:hypothetical protein